MINEAKKKKSEDIKFEYRTVGDFGSDDYDKHYAMNVSTKAEQSNQTDEITGNKKENIMLYCPKCGGANIYNSLMAEHLECDDCDSIFNREKATTEKKV